MASLSILICRLPTREETWRQLREVLVPQVDRPEVEVLTDNNAGSIGAKRQRLLERAEHEYVAFIDDDDLVPDDYVERILSALEGGEDCCSLRGIITTDDRDPRPFIHSLEFKVWEEHGGVYYRPPNHLNAVKRALALQVGFPDQSHGEDRAYSEALRPLLQTEADPGADPLYYYRYVSEK